MIIRTYNKEKDYAKVKALVEAAWPVDLPLKDDSGGYGIVSEEEGGEITGFAWALVSEESPIAFVDCFCVAPEKRGLKVYGPMIFTKLLKDLEAMGKREIVSVVGEENPCADSLAKVYKSVGCNVSKGYIFRASCQNVLMGIARRRAA